MLGRESRDRFWLRVAETKHTDIGTVVAVRSCAIRQDIRHRRLPDPTRSGDGRISSQIVIRIILIPINIIVNSNRHRFDHAPATCLRRTARRGRVIRIKVNSGTREVHSAPRSASPERVARGFGLAAVPQNASIRLRARPSCRNRVCPFTTSARPIPHNGAVRHSRPDASPSGRSSANPSPTCPAQRHALRVGSELPRILGDPPQRQDTTLLVGHRPAHRRRPRDGADAQRPGALAHRERDLPHPEQPRRLLRTQLRPRRAPSQARCSPT